MRGAGRVARALECRGGDLHPLPKFPLADAAVPVEIPLAEQVDDLRVLAAEESAYAQHHGLAGHVALRSVKRVAVVALLPDAQRRPLALRQAHGVRAEALGPHAEDGVEGREEVGVLEVPRALRV